MRRIRRLVTRRPEFSTWRSRADHVWSRLQEAWTVLQHAWRRLTDAIIRTSIKFSPTEAQRTFGVTLLAGATCGLIAVAFHLPFNLLTRR